MIQPEASNSWEAELLAELQQLRQEVGRLTRHNADLDIALRVAREKEQRLEAALSTARSRLKLDTVDLLHPDGLLFRAIAEATSVLLILTQQFNGVILYANAAATTHLAGGTGLLIGQELRNLFANPADADRMQAILAEQGSVTHYEMQIRGTGADLLWVSVSIQPLLQVEGQSWLTTLYDISDRKAAETIIYQSERQLRQQAQALQLQAAKRTAELRETEAKYRSIFENAAEGIFQITADGRYLSANPALAATYGYDSPEDLMDSITQIGQQLYVQPRRRDELNVYLKQFGLVEGFESQVYRKDGSIIWISENVREVRDSAGNLLYYEGSVRDITDRKATEAELRQQRLRAEKLLLNVLPQPIAERLKRGEKTIADSFSDVTVLFADIVNFTELSDQISPAEIVELLNTTFSSFDRLVDHYGLEKIKTIGDAYMVVGSLPAPKPDHVGAIANLALDMMQSARSIRTPIQHPLDLRIGIHTGPVVAGVIGTRKFIYDLWGDTVNVASRMESQGEPGRIQVTYKVYRELRNRFQLQQRGVVEIKGKGQMITYWLTGRKTEE